MSLDALECSRPSLLSLSRVRLRCGSSIRWAEGAAESHGRVEAVEAEDIEGEEGEEEAVEREDIEEGEDMEAISIAGGRIITVSGRWLCREPAVSLRQRTL